MKVYEPPALLRCRLWLLPINHMHITYGMCLWALDCSPHPCNQTHDLLQAPAEHLPDGIQRKSVQAHVHVQARIHAHLLHPLILWPPAVWDNELAMRDPIEPCIPSPPRHNLAVKPERPPELVPGVVKDLSPLSEDGVPFFVGQVRVRGAQLDVGLEMLEPAARLQSLEHLGVQLVPVVDGGVHVPDVDEVERVGLEGPRPLSVVDLEGYVGGSPGGLGWRDVGADYRLGVGEHVAHVDGPDGRAGADVEDLLEGSGVN